MRSERWPACLPLAVARSGVHAEAYEHRASVPRRRYRGQPRLVYGAADAVNPRVLGARSVRQ